jgi:hypothetical protein
LFTEGQQVHSDRFADWFDEKARSLGGRSAISTVSDLVGHCQSFDLSQLDDVPKKDLPDLIPFFHGMLVRNRRRPDREDGVFSFITPDAWQKSPGIRSRYEGLIFHRNPRDGDEAKKIVGVGHQVFDQAIAQAIGWEVALALIDEGPAPLALFRFQDAVTSQTGLVRQVVAGVTANSNGGLRLVRDEEVLEILNGLKSWPGELQPDSITIAPEAIERWLDKARQHAMSTVDALNLPFRKPLLTDLVLLWPAARES